MTRSGHPEDTWWDLSYPPVRGESGAVAGLLDGAGLDVDLRGEVACPAADALAARGVPFVFPTGYSGDAMPERYADVTRCDEPVDVRRVVELLFPAGDPRGPVCPPARGCAEKPERTLRIGLGREKVR